MGASHLACRVVCEMIQADYVSLDKLNKDILELVDKEGSISSTWGSSGLTKPFSTPHTNQEQKPAFIIIMETLETIASKLLQSSDARIAEAAKRVFTSSSSALLPKSRISPPSYAIASPTLSSMSSSLSSISGMGVVAAAALSSFAAGNAVPPPSTPSTPPVQNVGGVATTQYDPRFSSSSVHPGADSIGSNDGDVDELDENGKKLSTTDRLQRR